MKQTAVEWLVDKMLYIDNEYDMKLITKGEYQFKRRDIIEQAKEMEDSQATDYAKWSMDINQLTGHFFTFREWIKDEPKDDETSKQE